MAISLKDIKNAREIIDPFTKTTDLDRSRSCSELTGSDVYLKFENQQVTGSFKIRGAANKIHSFLAYIQISLAWWLPHHQAHDRHRGDGRHEPMAVLYSDKASESSLEGVNRLDL